MFGSIYNVGIAREYAYIMIETRSVHRHYKISIWRISGRPTLQLALRPLGWTADGQTYGQTYRISPRSTGLCPLSGPLPKKGPWPLRRPLIRQIEIL